MPTETHTVTVHGTDIEVEPVKELSGGGARLDLRDGDREWRVDVSRKGKLKEILTTWENGQLTDLDEPEWMDDLLARVGHVA